MTLVIIITAKQRLFIVELITIYF